jgi:hypothetical protein
MRLIRIGDRGVNLDLMTDFDLESKGCDYAKPADGNGHRPYERCVRLFFAVADVSPSIHSVDFFGDEAELMRRFLKQAADDPASMITWNAK